MLRWLVVIFFTLILINGLMPFLTRFGFGKLPGDFRFRLLGRDWFLPLSTTLLLSFVASAVSKFI